MTKEPDKFTSMTINNYEMKPHLCPVCFGACKMNAQFYPENRGTSLSEDVECKSCSGNGVIWG